MMTHKTKSNLIKLILFFFCFEITHAFRANTLILKFYARCKLNICEHNY